MQTNHCTVFASPMHGFGCHMSDKNRTQLVKIFRREMQHAVRDGVLVFRIALQLGSGIWLAEEMIRLRDICFPQIKVHVYISHETQANDWTEEWRESYFDIQAQADEVFILGDKLSAGVFRRQNRLLLQDAGRLIIVHDALLGGRADKLSHIAEKKGIEVQMIHLLEGPPTPLHLAQVPMLQTAYQESKSQVKSMYSDRLSSGKSASNSAW